MFVLRLIGIISEMKKPLPLYSVSQINAVVKTVIEECLPPRLTVRGQVSDWKLHSSGHCYFILKDRESQLAAVMWSSRYRQVKFEPENGLEVLATGHVELYPPQGKVQFYVDKLEPAGVGTLQLAFEQMKERLLKEGLFDQAHKKPIPPYPMRIGIITSRSGAALVDIADSIHHRWPCGRLYVFDVPVQGEGAADKIADRIRQVNQFNSRYRLDVLIVARGGGSMEDLWAFNEEALARAIFASRIPVISAVGHEVDVTIADFVSDARASTPTKAGVIAVPDIRDVTARLQTARDQIHRITAAKLDLLEAKLNIICASWIFREPEQIVDRIGMRLDDASVRLARAAQKRFSLLRELLERAAGILRQTEPKRLLHAHRLRLSRLEQVLHNSLNKILHKKELQLTVAENRLQAMDPCRVLKRGYSLTVCQGSGRVVTRISDVKPGDVIITELSDRQKIESRVEDIYCDQ